MANFGAVHLTISSSITLLFLKEWYFIGSEGGLVGSSLLYIQGGKNTKAFFYYTPHSTSFSEKNGHLTLLNSNLKRSWNISSLLVLVCISKVSKAMLKLELIK